MPTEVPNADVDMALTLGPRGGAGGARPPIASGFFLETMMRDGRRVIFASNCAFCAPRRTKNISKRIWSRGDMKFALC